MRLISEITEHVKYITEGKGKDLYIEGVFLQADLKNRNGRLYPGAIMEKEVKRYTEAYIDKKRAFGELGHPEGPTINLDRVSHMITSLKQEGSNYIGKAKVTDTPHGNIVKNLINEGAQLGVSSRGMGTLKANMKDGVLQLLGWLLSQLLYRNILHVKYQLLCCMNCLLLV